MSMHGYEADLKFGSNLPPYSEFGEHFVLPDDYVFLNHGSFGADVVNAAEGYIHTMRGKNPNLTYFLTAPKAVLEAHKYVGKLFDMPRGAYSFVQNTTEGVTTAFRTLLQNREILDIQEGDEILTTSHEYGACINQLKALLPKGVELKVADVPFPISSPEEVTDAVFRLVTDRTRMFFISHVTSPTGVIFPIEDIVPTLEAENIRCVVDGAHAPGMIPKLKPTAYNASFYIANLHKWLCAPPGSAFVLVKKELQDFIVPPVDGWGVTRDLFEGELRWQARMMSRGVVDYRPWIDTPLAIEALKDVFPGGLDEMAIYNRQKLFEARKIVQNALCIEEYAAPDSMIGSLATIPLPLGQRFPGEASKIAATLAKALREHYKIEVPVIDKYPTDSASIRISYHVYNAMGQYEYLGAALRDFLGIK